MFGYVVNVNALELIATVNRRTPETLTYTSGTKPECDYKLSVGTSVDVEQHSKPTDQRVRVAVRTICGFCVQIISTAAGTRIASKSATGFPRLVCIGGWNKITIRRDFKRCVTTVTTPSTLLGCARTKDRR